MDNPGATAPPLVGAFVRVRGRRWLVEGESELGDRLTSLRLACIDDDAQGETTEVVWGAELDADVFGDEGWEAVAQSGTDAPPCSPPIFGRCAGTPRPPRS